MDSSPFVRRISEQGEYPLVLLRKANGCVIPRGLIGSIGRNDILTEATNGNGTERPYLTIKEAAPLAGVAPYFLYRRIKRKLKSAPPHVRRGVKILLPRAEFFEWLKQKVIP